MTVFFYVQALQNDEQLDGFSTSFGRRIDVFNTTIFYCFLAVIVICNKCTVCSVFMNKTALKVIDWEVQIKIVLCRSLFKLLGFLS